MPEIAIDAQLSRTIDEVRDYAHRLGAHQLIATMPTLDGETDIDYRPGDWLRITTRDRNGENIFVLPPDWTVA